MNIKKIMFLLAIAGFFVSGIRGDCCECQSGNAPSAMTIKSSDGSNSCPYLWAARNCNNVFSHTLVGAKGALIANVNGQNCPNCGHVLTSHNCSPNDKGVSSCTAVVVQMASGQSCLATVKPSKNCK